MHGTEVPLAAERTSHVGRWSCWALGETNALQMKQVGAIW